MLPTQISSHACIYRDIQHLVGYQDIYKATEATGLEVIIKIGSEHPDVRTYDISQEETTIYFVRGLNKFIYQNEQGEDILCFVYEKHEPLKSWMNRGGGANAFDGHSFTQNFLQILR